MGWSFHYDIVLERELSDQEREQLAQVCKRHGLWLRELLSVAPLSTWRDHLPAAEYRRLEALDPRRCTRARGRLRVRDVAQLLKLIVWLKEVEAMLPFKDFEVQDTYVLTEASRPSEVDLERLRSHARRDRLHRRAELAEDSGVDRDLAEAAAAFARWKRSRP